MNSSTRSVTATKRYRVVQWATGNVGSRALRRAIEHPDLDLVGVWVHSAAKVGRDAGELAGLEPIGIKATNSMEDVLAELTAAPFTREDHLRGVPNDGEIITDRSYESLKRKLTAHGLRYPA